MALVSVLGEPLLKFVSVGQQVQLLLWTCKSASAVFSSNEEFWRHLCSSLCSQRRLWLPEELDGFQETFRELWILRNRFFRQPLETQEVPREGLKFKLQTFCRFRDAKVGSDANRGATIELPLHQRVALLRRSHPEISHREAVKRVMAAVRAGAEAAEAAESLDAGSQVPDKVGLTASVLSMQCGRGGSVLTVGPTVGLRSFEFGYVFGANASQQEVYRECGLRLVADLMNGVNGALILYGQTGSGKTYTMFGPDGAEGVTRGLAFRISEAVLAALPQRSAAGLTVSLGLSYVEVFGSDILDLLAKHSDSGNFAPLPQRLAQRMLLDGQLEVPIKAECDLAAALELGESRKRRARTAMNARSTRAHALVVLHLLQVGPEEGALPVSSKLFLADLGGSERVTKSHANEDAKTAGFVSWEEYYRSRQRLQETSYINQGLLSLKRCIKALGENQQRLAAGRPALPVTFRESKLTAALEPALGGLARTSVVVCCSPDGCHAEETLQTLRFGEMCSRIEHVQKVVADPSSAVAQALKQIDLDIAEVELLIKENERWEWRETVRTDVVDASTAATAKMNETEEMELGGFGAVEFLPDTGEASKEEVHHTVRGQVLVGAEAERERLEQLLECRRKLLGEA